MKIMLIDAGNTTIDCRFFNQKTQQITKSVRLATKDFLKISPKTFLDQLNLNSDTKVRIIYSSVVPDFNTWLTKLPQSFSYYNIRESKKIQNSDFSFPWSHLGADLIANFYARNWQDAIIINCGTASTLSLIDGGVFQGTIIAPGVVISLQALVNSAALLKPMAYQWEIKEIGQTTKTAIGLGAINGHYEMLKALAKNRSTPKTKVIFTGGNAELFKIGIGEDGFEYDETLIFQGLIKLSEIQ